MTDRTWHKGPPPHVGWWNASTIRDKKSWRWWGGDQWSTWAYPYESKKDAAYLATRPSYEPGIEWSDYYPKDARVPRIDPRKFQQSKE